MAKVVVQEEILQVQTNDEHFGQSTKWVFNCNPINLKYQSRRYLIQINNYILVYDLIKMIFKI